MSLDPATERALAELEKRQLVLDRLETVLTKVFGEVKIRVLGDHETWEQVRESESRQGLQSIWSIKSRPRWRR